MRSSGTLIGIVLIVACGAQGGILRVDDDAAAGGDGQSWATAYRHLQDALHDASSGDMIWVAAGVYHPDESEGGHVTPGDRHARFEIPDGVRLYGGFLGHERSLLHRPRNPDPETLDLSVDAILSGDLDDNDGPEFANTEENSLNVVYAENVDTILDYFTITGGNANLAPDDDTGGGMRVMASDIFIRNCTFVGNQSSERGGGLYLEEGEPMVAECTFLNNRSSYGGGLGQKKADSFLYRCAFRGNAAGYDGGGVMLTGGTSFVFGCVIEGNHADRYCNGSA